nr:NTP-binding domain [Parsnip yellow fleck virus]
AQGLVSKIKGFGSLWKFDEEEETLNSELQKMAVEVSGEIDPIQDEGWAKRKINEIVSSVSTKLIEASTSILSNAATRAISTLFDVMIGKVRGVLSSLVDSISGAFKMCLGDPKCLCLIGISISAVLGYCTLKLVENSVPDALGIFKALMMVAITSISALYWPKAAISIVTKYEEQFKDIENYCSTIYKHIFLGVSEDKMEGATPAKACATNFEDLAHGKAQAGGKSFLELAGLIAYIRLCVVLCKAMNTSFLEPFTPSNMEKQCRTVGGISIGVKTLCEFKDYIYRMIVGGITPTSSYVKVSGLTGFDIREWFEEVESVTLQETRYTQMGSDEKIKQIRALYDKGVNVMGKLTMIDSPHLSRVCERSFRLCKELLDETHRCKGASSTRVDPFHVSLYGSPGVGKSFVMGKLLDDVLDFMSEPQADRCYSKTPNEEYWSGYIGQTAVKCDDLGQDLSKGFSPTYNQIIQMKTNNCFIVPMADLANKGRTFTSKYIFSTTNVPGCGTKHGLADPGAFMRRRNIFVEVETEGDMIPGSTNHMRFTLLNPLNPDERIMKYPARMKYVDFLCVCVAEARVYFETQNLVMETLNGTTKNQEEPSKDVIAILEELGDGVVEGILEKRKELLSQFGVMDPPPFDAIELEPGKAQASVCFSTDAFGNPLKNPFVELFGKLRDEFERATKQEMPDDILTKFGASLTLGEPTVFGYENQCGMHSAKDSNLMSSFFTFIFGKNLIYKQEQEFLRHIDTLSSMGVLRLVDAVTTTTKGDKKILSFANIYDNQAFEQLGVLERLIFHLVLATRAAKKGRINGIRERLANWFTSARILSNNILEELPS